MSDTFLPWVLDEWLFNNSYDVISAWCFFTPHCSTALAFTGVDQVYDHGHNKKDRKGCVSLEHSGLCISTVYRMVFV